MNKAISVYGYKKNQLLRWLAALAVATSSLWVTPAAVAKDHHDEELPQCQELQVPVSLTQPSVPGATLYGELYSRHMGHPPPCNCWFTAPLTTGTTRIGRTGRISILTYEK